MSELSSGGDGKDGAHTLTDRSANMAPGLAQGLLSTGESKKGAKSRNSLRDLFEGNGGGAAATYASVEAGTILDSARGALPVGLQDGGKSSSLQSGATPSVAMLESIPEVDREKEQSRPDHEEAEKEDQEGGIGGNSIEHESKQVSEEGEETGPDSGQSSETGRHEEQKRGDGDSDGAHRAQGQSDSLSNGTKAAGPTAVD